MEEQTYRIEIRFDFTGTKKQAEIIGSYAIGSLPPQCHNGEITAIFDEDFEEV